MPLELTEKGEGAQRVWCDGEWWRAVSSVQVTGLMNPAKPLFLIYKAEGTLNLWVVMRTT